MIVDLFAGPGGWDEGLRLLGIHDVVGIEWDTAACDTARAAGHERVQADVSALDPRESEPITGLIASPPCPTFSAAGKGAGRRDVDHIIQCARELAAGEDTREKHREACEDERSMLTVEPLRWALMTRPEWIALEQVPPVLEIWELFAYLLDHAGYSCWTGVLEAERYGVPQTRERAILMGKRGEHVVHPPRPTHQRYVPGEPQRHDLTFDGEVLPWVSMAEALGWGLTEAPYPTIASSRTTGGPDKEKVGGSGARSFLCAEQRRGAWALRVTNDRPNATNRDLDDPAPSLAFGHNAPVWVQRERSGDRAEEGFDPHAEPCQTLTSKSRSWTLHTNCDQRDDGSRQTRPTDEPAPAFTAKSGGQWKWTHDRPATTVAGDPRVHPPGHKRNADDGRAGRSGYEGRAGQNAIRVSVEEASVLQSFRPDYPWAGSRTKQFQQVGNAVPPLLARAVLAELVQEET